LEDNIEIDQDCMGIGGNNLSKGKFKYLKIRFSEIYVENNNSFQYLLEQEKNEFN
jgi:hypothetical protein